MEQFSNNPTTTITTSGGINSSATSFTVASAGPFPSSGTFRIIVDGEIMAVTGVSGSTFTVTRGNGGSVAASHAQGAAVYAILTAEALNALVTIQSAGTEISDRRVINFVSGATVADNAGAGRCDITLGGNISTTYQWGNFSYGVPALASLKDVSVSGGATHTLLDTTGGASAPGYIDQIWIGINDSSSTDAREKSTLSFFRDGEGTASFIIPTGLLMMLYWGPSGFATRYIGALTYSDSGSGYAAHKIPWTASMKVVFTNGDASNAITLYSDISYKTGSSINWGNAAHLKCNYALSQSITAYATTTLLNISGQGLFYGLNMAFDGGDANYNYLEGAFEVYIDGSMTPSMVWSGTEDYFLQGQYFANGVMCADNAGCTTKGSGGQQVSAYRFHIDDPIPFTTGIKVTWTAGNATYATVTNNVTIWYAALYYLNA